MSRDAVHPLSRYKLCDDTLFYPGCCPDHDRISLASKNSLSPNSESLFSLENENVDFNSDVFDDSRRRRSQSELNNARKSSSDILICYLINCRKVDISSIIISLYILTLTKHIFMQLQMLFKHHIESSLIALIEDYYYRSIVLD